jgi:Na+/H+-translocating membrane pyrophosphatase
MSHEYCVLVAVVAGLIAGAMAGFIAGVWKAAKMQALREISEAQFNKASQAIAQGTRINPVPMPSPGRGRAKESKQ